MTTTVTPPDSFRKVLHSAYTLVRSVEANKALSTVTLDHLIQEQITLLDKDATRPLMDGKGGVISDVKGQPLKRRSRRNQLVDLQASVASAIEQIKAASGDEAKMNALGLFTKVTT